MKLLHIDIETTPAKVLTWALFKQNISVDQILEPTSILCFAAKWDGEKELIYHKSQKQSGPAFDRMIRAAYKLLSEADAVCHFNGNSFDIPRLNTEFIRLGLTPPKPIHNIDLKITAQKKFGFVSNRLAFLGPALGLGAKVRHEGWDLWKDCMKGIPEAWVIMEKYNKQDVVLLEKLYHKFLPWIDQHPNRFLFSQFVDLTSPHCTHCLSARGEWRGEQVTVTNVYKRWHCKDCGRWGRARTAEKGIKVAVR
jgi:hypothetical protein